MLSACRAPLAFMLAASAAALLALGPEFHHLGDHLSDHLAGGHGGSGAAAHPAGTHAANAHADGVRSGDVRSGDARSAQGRRSPQHATGDELCVLCLALASQDVAPDPVALPLPSREGTGPVDSAPASTPLRPDLRLPPLRGPPHR